MKWYLKKWKWVIVGFAMLLSLSSCFELVEEVSMNLDGSGSFKISLNLNQSKSTLDGFKNKDSIDHYKVPKTADIDAKVSEAMAKLKAVKGISNVTSERNHTDYIYTLKCNFTNLTALNTAINTLWMSYDKNAPVKPTTIHFYKNGTAFGRLFQKAWLQEKGSRLNAVEKRILQSAMYIAAYKFPNEVLSHSHPEGKISKSGKAVVLRVNMLDLVQLKNTIKNEIKLKP